MMPVDHLIVGVVNFATIAIYIDKAIANSVIFILASVRF